VRGFVENPAVRDDVDGVLEEFLFGKGREINDELKNGERNQFLNELDWENPNLLVIGDGEKMIDDDGKLATGIEFNGNAKRTKLAEKQKQTAAWKDEDDGELSGARVDLMEKNRLRKLRNKVEETTVDAGEYEQRLRTQFVKMQPGLGRWADKVSNKDSGKRDTTDVNAENNQSAEVNDMTAVMKTTADLISQKCKILPSGELNIRRVRDANAEAPSRSVVQSVKFHQSGRLILTAGYDKSLRIFRVDGKYNAKLRGIHFPDLPIHSADFCRKDGTEIVVSGRRRFFYSVEVETGITSRIQTLRDRKEKSLERMKVSASGRYLAFAESEGRVSLLCSHTKRIIGGVKMNSEVRDMAFGTEISDEFLTFGADSCIYIWDVRMQSRCVERHFDAGGAGNGTVIDCGSSASRKSGFLYSTGQTSGVVNIYNSSSAMIRGSRLPIKEVMNLTTPISCVRFSKDNQMMLIASRETRNGFRIVHLPSLTVFSNWPTVKTTLRRVNCAEFSPGSGYLAIGNDSGSVMLYRLNHFQPK